MKISFVIINYKSRDYLDGCIRSIFDKVDDATISNVVIVNSEDEKLNLDAWSNLDKIDIIEINNNVGFGKGHNIGAKSAKGDVLCLFNPDARIVSGDVNDVVDEFKRDSQIGVIGARINKAENKNRKKEVQEWSVGEDINIWNTILNNLGFPRSRKLWSLNVKTEVDWVTGASLFIKKDTFDSVNGFDENFFLYFEDIDLCKRVRHSGKKVFYFPEVEVYHIGGGSSSDKRKQKRLYYQSQDHYFKKWFGSKTSKLMKFLRKFHLST